MSSYILVHTYGEWTQAPAVKVSWPHPWTVAWAARGARGHPHPPSSRTKPPTWVPPTSIGLALCRYPGTRARACYSVEPSVCFPLALLPGTAGRVYGRTRSWYVDGTPGAARDAHSPCPLPITRHAWSTGGRWMCVTVRIIFFLSMRYGKGWKKSPVCSFHRSIVPQATHDHPTFLLVST